MNLKGTKTEQNLMTAFAGESQARNKYTFFGKAARKEGYEQIGEIFDSTAENERAHALIWFRLLGGISNTNENLKIAAAGENSEWTEMYPAMARDAREEGFESIAKLFEGVAAIEKEHEARFKTFQQMVEKNEVFTKPAPQTWICRNCGYIVTGVDSAPAVCPICAHPQAYFEVLSKKQ